MASTNPLAIGLTGGIASGKSLASHYFSELNIDIIDTDIIAREIVLPNTTAWQAIVEHVGESILQQDKQINRRQLRKIIFSNAQEKQWLETLLHPMIRTQILERLKYITSAYCIICIPLLAESWPYPNIDRVLVIDTNEATQLQRAMQRDTLSEEQALAILKHQASRKQRLQIANEIIENNSTKEELRRNVQKTHDYYLKLLENDH